MITAVHTLIYSDDPDATRAFLRDVLQLPSVGGDEWPIYRTGPSELASTRRCRSRTVRPGPPAPTTRSR